MDNDKQPQPDEAKQVVITGQRKSSLHRRWLVASMVLPSIVVIGIWLYSTRSPAADYAPLALVFVSAINGIAGKSWDATQKGLARLTLKGRVLILLAVLGLVVGIRTTRDNHTKLAEVEEVRNMAYSQLMKGVSMMLYPVTSCWKEPPKNDLALLERAADATTVEVLAKTRLVPFADPVEDVMANIEAPRLYLVGVNGTRVVARGGPPHRGFRALYELFDFLVDAGDAKVRDTEKTFFTSLEPKTIRLLHDVLEDKFYESNYRNLSQHEDLYFQGLLDEAGNSKNPTTSNRTWLALLAVQRALLPSEDETPKQNHGPSPSLYLGTYYFGGTSDLAAYHVFLAKVGELVRHVGGLLKSDQLIETF